MYVYFAKITFNNQTKIIVAIGVARRPSLRRLKDVATNGKQFLRNRPINKLHELYDNISCTCRILLIIIHPSNTK